MPVDMLTGSEAEDSTSESSDSDSDNDGKKDDGSFYFDFDRLSRSLREFSHKSILRI